MGGILLLILFLASGIIISNKVFMQMPVYVRMWIGVMIGIAGLMWLAVPFSFLFGFSIISHVLALTVMLALCFLSIKYNREKSSLHGWKDPTALTLYCLVVPISFITMLLLYTHVLFPRPDGLYSGQSTYGDLCLHLGIITSIAEQGQFPPMYSILPGQLLSYPFLPDSLSSSLYLFGTSLRWAVLIPSFFLVVALVAGFFLLAFEILKNRFSSVLATILFFFNGGFGFSYFLDEARGNPYNFSRIFTEFYQTPTNLPDYGLRWVNIICDMIIPQRTTMAGWAFLFLALWLLYRAIENSDTRLFTAAGLTAGLMPLIHTHSFLALGIISVIWFLVYLFQTKHYWKYVKQWFFFGIPAAVLSLPQLFYWTFSQASGEGFLKPMFFNWLSSQHKDPMLWFWIKNVGVVMILLVPALLSAKKRIWSVYSGALAIFIVANLVIFQPNEYDNNKLFYIWYAFSTMLVSGFISSIYLRIKGMRARWSLLAVLLLFSTLSSFLTLERERVSSYRLFSTSELAAAEFIKEHTPADALFITSDNHNNTVASLSGRNILAGTGSYLFFHGLNYQERASAVEAMYKQPENFPDLSARYQVDYVYFSSWERGRFSIDPTYFAKNYPLVFQREDIYIFAISERAKKFATK